MKFLVLAKTRGTPQVPPEQLRGMVVRQWQTALQHQKEGKIEVGYSLVGQKGGMAIHDAESGAELNARLMRTPLYMFSDFEIYPLMTLEESLTQAKQALEAVKAQK